MRKADCTFVVASLGAMLVGGAFAADKAGASLQELLDAGKPITASAQAAEALKDPKVSPETIYHGAEEAVLQTGAGHLGWSSLPVGGESTHAVLSGHRGLPDARLFTDLDRLTEGDLFTVTVLDRTLTYEVDRILTVSPHELDSLKIQPGEDLCTLVTCTPYGVNTHRLLVRGHRVEPVSGETDPSADTQTDPQSEPGISLRQYIEIGTLFSCMLGFCLLKKFFHERKG